MTATVTRVAAQATQACRFAAGKKARWSAVKRVHDLRLLRLKRAPHRVIQSLPSAAKNFFSVFSLFLKVLTVLPIQDVSHADRLPR